MTNLGPKDKSDTETVVETVTKVVEAATEAATTERQGKQCVTLRKIVMFVIFVHIVLSKKYFLQ